MVSRQATGTAARLLVDCTAIQAQEHGTCRLLHRHSVRFTVDGLHEGRHVSIRVMLDAALMIGAW